MGITVSDIERKEFAYKGAGYDPYDVDQYLDQICDEMVAMQDRIVQLEKELEDAQREVEQAKHAAQPVPPAAESAPAEPYARPAAAEPPVARTSEALEAILINAQRLADDAVENANRKAEDLLNKAKEEADGITQGAYEEKERIEAEYASLKEAAQTFKENFLKILDEHKSLFNRQLKETGV
ncbi:MAG: DivIVA domain-containing protein [Clostridiales bacterium]|nr:DivIVA domain-containing protein [Clostridiales bacterium]